MDWDGRQKVSTPTSLPTANRAPPPPPLVFPPPDIGLCYPTTSLPALCSQRLNPSGLVLGFSPKSPHPPSAVNLHLLSLKPQPTLPQIGSFYPTKRPSTIHL